MASTTGEAGFGEKGIGSSSRTRTDNPSVNSRPGCSCLFAGTLAYTHAICHMNGQRFIAATPTASCNGGIDQQRLDLFRKPRPACAATRENKRRAQRQRWHGQVAR
jgi:hypothetical protein